MSESFSQLSKERSSPGKVNRSHVGCLILDVWVHGKGVKIMEEPLSSGDAGKYGRSPVHVFLVNLAMFKLHPRRRENSDMTLRY